MIALLASLALAQVSVSVADHGAVPDDGIDDRPAFTLAMIELSLHGGGTLVIPPGEYTWATWEHRHRHLLIDVPVIWEGAGRDTTRIRVTAHHEPSQRALLVSGTHDVVLRGFELDYTRPFDYRKQGHAILSYDVDGLRVEGVRLVAGSGDALYVGADVQGLVVSDLEADAARGLVTVAGNSRGRFRAGYRISGVRRIDRGAVPPGARYQAVNFERADGSEDTFWGVEIEDVEAADGTISVAACVGARVRRVRVSQLWYHLGRTTLVDSEILGRAGPYGDGDGCSLLANGPGELVVIGGAVRVPTGGACAVYQRLAGDGPRSVEGYGVDIDIAPGATLHHFSQWAGSKWYDLTEVTP